MWLVASVASIRDGARVQGSVELRAVPQSTTRWLYSRNGPALLACVKLIVQCPDDMPAMRWVSAKTGSIRGGFPLVHETATDRAAPLPGRVGARDKMHRSETEEGHAHAQDETSTEAYSASIVRRGEVPGTWFSTPSVEGIHAARAGNDRGWTASVGTSAMHACLMAAWIRWAP